MLSAYGPLRAILRPRSPVPPADPLCGKGSSALRRRLPKRVSRARFAPGPPARKWTLTRQDMSRDQRFHGHGPVGCVRLQTSRTGAWRPSVPDQVPAVPRRKFCAWSNSLRSCLEVVAPSCSDHPFDRWVSSSHAATTDTPLAPRRPALAGLRHRHPPRRQPSCPSYD